MKHSAFILFILTLLFSRPTGHAETPNPPYFNNMNITSILFNLTEFKQLLNPIEEIAKEEYKQELTQELYQAYTFIKLRLYEVPDSGSSYQKLHAECTFKIENGGKIILEEIFCDNKKTQHDIEQYLKQYMDKNILFWHEETPAVDTDTYYSSQLEALYNADLIAKVGYLCDHSYSPGYYGEILIKENSIELTQVNRRNSKSSDHKDNYYMRDVKFIIPFNADAIPKEHHYEYIINNLYIEFRDSSSPQNKECGNRMKEKIAELNSK